LSKSKFEVDPVKNWSKEIEIESESIKIRSNGNMSSRARIARIGKLEETPHAGGEVAADL
jgi:hypothetical protein